MSNQKIKLAPTEPVMEAKFRPFEVQRGKPRTEDYSATCNLNDEDTNNKCWQCARFCFPIGCMVYTDGHGRAKLEEEKEKRNE